MIERARAGSLFRAGLLLVGACLMAVGLRTWADTETDWLELSIGNCRLGNGQRDALVFSAVDWFDFLHSGADDFAGVALH